MPVRPPTPRVSERHELRTEVQQFKRRRILEQSRELFFVKGYEATTLDTIAAALDVTKPFLYSYFKNKSEILHAICDIGIRQPLVALDGALAINFSPGNKLRLVIERVTAAVIENQQSIVVYEREETNLEPDEARHLLDLRAEFIQKLAQLLTDGVNAGEFRIDDPELTATSISGLLIWIALWYRENRRWMQTDLVLHMIQVVERMVARTASNATAA